MNRKHLANMRVVQKNLVYVVGLSSKLAKEEVSKVNPHGFDRRSRLTTLSRIRPQLIPTLRSNEYFGQYGRISKILISKRTTASKLVMGTSESNIGVYVTYHRKEDAARAIVAIDGSKGRDGKILRASYGTTKYCTTYLRNLPCTNPACTYLHEPGEEADSFTKEDLSTLRHAARDLENKTKPSGLPPAGPSASAQFPPKALTSAGQTSVGAMTSVDSSSLSEEASALPKTASWASGKPGSTAPAPLGTNGLSGVLDDSDMPPLSANILKKPTTANKIAKQTAGATLSARTVQTPTSFKAKMAGSSSQPTNNSVAVKNPVRDGSSVGSPALTVPPGLSQMADASQRPATPSAPPGLTKPLGLAPPLTAPPPSSTPVSNYQPSPSAQAILDDIRSRREAEPEQPQPSPFPDFEYTLSRFSDGDFSFNFLGVRSDDKTTGAVVNGDSLGAFAPFSAIFDESPHLSRAPSHAAATMYSGSFDPFSGEEVSLGGVKRIDSPFKALEEMRRSLSEERAAAGHDRGGGQQQDAVLEGNEADDANNRASRFDFAKGAPQARSDRLLRTDMYNDQDPLALSRDVSGILGNVFDNEPNSISSGSSGLYRETKIYGRATQAQAQAAQQAAQAQFQAQAQHAIIAQQQRAIVGPPGLLSFGGASSQQSSNSNWYYELQQQRQQQVQANGYGGYSATGAGAAATPPTASSEPLLAQIMAATGGARSSVFGATVGALGGPSGQQVPGSASDGHSFFDPAMLSMRGQGQGHQQLPSLPQLGGFSSFDHQQHHGNASYVGPGGASTSPAAGVFHRSPYSTMS